MEHTTLSMAAPPQPERIGPYRILHVLGEGGMGIVYEAEETEALKRRVALKVIRAGLDSREVFARFQIERQALAVMDHPAIAKVLQAGTAESGQPYFAMELVKGLPIVRYCDMRRLSIAERVELFIAVLQGTGDDRAGMIELGVDGQHANAKQREGDVGIHDVRQDLLLEGHRQ